MSTPTTYAAWEAMQGISPVSPEAHYAELAWNAGYEAGHVPERLEMGANRMNIHTKAKAVLAELAEWKDHSAAKLHVIQAALNDAYEAGRTQGFADGYNERDTEDDLGE